VDGLGIATYKQISFSFTVPANGAMNVHIGSHSVSGLTNQTGGTVFTYGWQIFVKGRTTVLETDLIVNGNITAGALPLFRNGSSVSNISSIIPLFLTQSSVYNYAEIKISFTTNTLATLLTFIGNTQNNGDGNDITLVDCGETSRASTQQGSPTYTQNGTMAVDVVASGTTNQLKMCITKGNNALTNGNRNYYSFETIYCQNNTVGSVRVVGFGYLANTSLASIILKCSGAQMNTTWSTVHYY
jgi:hypothetical protein